MEAKIPFPQADNVYKLLLYLFEFGSIETPQELTTMSVEEMVPRQESYYKSALEYLGLIYQDALTIEGQYLVHSKIPIMLRLLALRILLHEPFATYYHSKDELYVEHYLSEKEMLSDSTVYRRKQTVKSWIDWIENVLRKDKYHE